MYNKMYCGSQGGCTFFILPPVFGCAQSMKGVTVAECDMKIIQKNCVLCDDLLQLCCAHHSAMQNCRCETFTGKQHGAPQKSMVQPQFQQ